MPDVFNITLTPTFTIGPTVFIGQQRAAEEHGHQRGEDARQPIAKDHPICDSRANQYENKNDRRANSFAIAGRFISR